MTPHRRAKRYGGQAGFTVIELLFAMTITLLIAAALAGLTQPARATFDRVPAELDLHQRGRTAIDVVSQALRSAGRNVPATDLLGPLGDLLPAVSVSEPDESGAFGSLTVIAPVPDAAQGVLSSDQANPGAPFLLSTARCPNVPDVCGFTPETTALVSDGAGHSDVFSIVTTDAGMRRLSPGRALSQSYPAGSTVVEVDRLTYSLATQSDGGRSLIRETAAGAVQPIADHLSGLSFAVAGRNVPAGFFRVDRVDIWVRVAAPTDVLRRTIPDRVFRTSIALRNAS